MALHDDNCVFRCGDGGSSRAEEGASSEFGHRQRQDHLPSSERPQPHPSARTPQHRRGFTSMAMRIQAAAAVAVLAVLCSVPEASSMSLQLHAKTTLMAPAPPRSLRRGGLGRSAAFATLPFTPTVRWCGGITAPGWGGADKHPSALKICPRVKGGGKAAAGLSMQEQPLQGESEQSMLKLPASRLTLPHHPTASHRM